MKWIPLIGLRFYKYKTVGEAERADKYFWIWFIWQIFSGSILVFSLLLSL